MATSFPTGTDNFNIPNSPGSTALSSSGTGSRNHVQHHRDLGDAIEAMQAEATRAAHSHDGSTARHGNKLNQANTHQSADTDVSASSIHHTLGHGANQAAPGNHAGLEEFQDTHADSVSWPIGSIFLSTSGTNPGGTLGGTWVQVQDVFLVGAGGSYTFTGSVVANSSSHTHSVGSTSASGSHTHTIASSNSQGSHTHDGGTSGSSSVSHSHSSTQTGTVQVSGLDVDSNYVAGTGSDGDEAHSHSMTGSATSTSHSHSINDYASTGAHTHSVSSVSGSTHTHTVSTSSTAHLPTWKAFYAWKRTA